MFAECPNGIRIYDKKFSCIASAFEYKRCQTAGCTEKELEKFPSLDGEAALAYGKTLTENRVKQKALENSNWLNHEMTEVIQAKYAQNLQMFATPWRPVRRAASLPCAGGDHRKLLER